MKGFKHWIELDENFYNSMRVAGSGMNPFGDGGMEDKLKRVANIKTFEKYLHQPMPFPQLDSSDYGLKQNNIDYSWWVAKHGGPSKEQKLNIIQNQVHLWDQLRGKHPEAEKQLA